MAIVLSRTTNDILVNGVSVATDAEVSSAVASGVAPKANTADTFGTSLLQTYNGTATKAFGVTYTNNTGRPKHITVIQGPTTSTMTLTIDGVICDIDSISSSDYSTYTSVQGIVPNGKTYIVSISGVSGGVYRWIESY